MEITHSLCAFARVTSRRISGNTLKAAICRRNPNSLFLVTSKRDICKLGKETSTKYFHSDVAKTRTSCRFTLRAFSTSYHAHYYGFESSRETQPTPSRKHFWNYEEERQAFSLDTPEFYNFSVDKVRFRCSEAQILHHFD